MNCEKFYAHIYGYHYDLLENEEKNEFEQHLQSCYECKEKLEQQEAGLSLLQIWQPQGEVQVMEKVIPVKSKQSYWKVAAVFFFLTSIAFSMLFVWQNNKMSNFSMAKSNYNKSIEYNSKQLKDLQIKYQQVSKRYEKTIAKQQKQRKYVQKFAEEQVNENKVTAIIQKVKQQKSPGVWYSKVQNEMQALKSLESNIHGASIKTPVIDSFYANLGMLKNIPLEMSELGVIAYKIKDEKGYSAQEILQKKYKISHSPVAKRRIQMTLNFLRTKTIDVDVDSYSGRLHNSIATMHSKIDNSRPLENKDVSNAANAMRLILKAFKNSFQQIESELTRLQEAKTLSQKLENFIAEGENSEEQQLLLQTELNNALAEINEKDKLIQKQQRDLVEAKQIIQAAENPGANLGRLYNKEKPLDGVITAVSKKLPLVMLSLGSDHNVLKGYQFTIFREAKYIGTVVVKDVYKEACAARIIKVKTKEKIKKGDIVTTRFGDEYGTSEEKDPDKSKVIDNIDKGQKIYKEKTLTQYPSKKKQIRKSTKTSRQELEDQIVSRESSEEEQLVVQTKLENILAEIRKKETTIQKQQRELTEAKQIIAAAEKQGVRFNLIYTREKPLDGFITAVSKKLPLVMLSLGSDDKVLKGYEFTILRGEKYLGTVVVEDVYKDACAARILESKTKIKIKKGDSATTRFGGMRGASKDKSLNENEMIEGTTEELEIYKEETPQRK